MPCEELHDSIFISLAKEVKINPIISGKPAYDLLVRNQKGTKPTYFRGSYEEKKHLKEFVSDFESLGTEYIPETIKLVYALDSILSEITE